MRFWMVSFFLLALQAHASSAASISPREHALQKLLGAGISEELIHQFNESYSEENRSRIIGSNIFGFLLKPDYSPHLSEQAVTSCREFLRKYRSTLARTQARHGVPSEVITALLWVETRHGKNTGNLSVTDVYFSLLQADHPEVLAATQTALAEKTSDITDEVRQKVTARSVSKAAWALKELQAIDEIYQGRMKSVTKAQGSYAGAFGIPQFLPSSYLKWARSPRKVRSPDLFQMPDAIESVGHYLRSNGWKPRNRESQKAALKHYNRSDAYVDTILTLADQLRPRAKARSKTTSRRKGGARTR